MFAIPTSSPQITRMLGLRPDGVGGCCWACAARVRSTALIAVAAASDVPASKMLRRLNTLLDDVELLGPFSLLSPGILRSSTMKTENYSTGGFLMTQRNPR